MDTKTKIHIIISIILVSLITILAYWIQIPSGDIKAQVIDTDTVLVRIQDYAFDPDIVRIDTDTTVSWLNDETEADADIQHTITSYDPEDPAKSGDEFESDILSLGQTFSYTFEEEGVFYYNCSLYPFMAGKVCVGDESEILDEECAIPLTEADEGLGEVGALGEEEEEALEDEEEALEEDLEDLEALGEDEEDLEDLEGPLFEAADEELEDLEDEEAEDLEAFEPDGVVPPSQVAVIDYSGEVPQVLSGAALEAKEDGAELSDSGPEDVIYIFVLLFALYAAKKLNKGFST